MLIDIVWNNIVKNKGETFYTKVGLPFTYTIKGYGIIPSRTNQIIGKSEFCIAIAHLPIDGPGEINHIVRGSSYVYALLIDKRINNFFCKELNKDMLSNKSHDLIQIFDMTNHEFLSKELSLLISDVSERCLCAAMKPFFEDEIHKYQKYRSYHVDVEYNRNAGHVKTIINDKLEVIAITCDLIVHSRGENESFDNLIALEMKKFYRPQNEKDTDKMRLLALTKSTSTNEIWSYDGKTFPKHVCGYKLGIYYEINLAKKVIKIEYYVAGKLIKTSNTLFNNME